MIKDISKFWLNNVRTKSRKIEKLSWTFHNKLYVKKSEKTFKQGRTSMTYFILRSYNNNEKIALK